MNAAVTLVELSVGTTGLDFGDTRAEGQSMAAASIAALTSTHRQLGVLYNAAGTRLGIQSLWSLNRDQPCSVNYPDITRVNDSCSGFAQGTERFSVALAQQFTGTPQQAAGAVTTPEPTTSASAIVDDPATSPYPIWNPLSSYPAGTKIVLRGNVYEAEWWTRGDVPDDPVLQEAQTPWRLIGPVLPGETPVPVPTLPANFFPAWKADVAYPAGKRVVYSGMAFEARWWSTATSPESSLIDPGGSPWAALSQQEIRKLLQK